MAKITVMLGGQEIGSSVMKKSPWTVGRDASCGVHIDNAGVSRSHCRFTYDGDRYFVEDAGSSNGTFFQGQRLASRAEVRGGDQVNIGKYVLVFSDEGMEMLPEVDRAGAAPAGGGAGSAAGGGAMLTFQVDPATLKKQMERAGAAASATQDARRASDIAKEFDLNKTLAARKRSRGGHAAVLAIKLVGLAIILGGITVAIMFVLKLTSES